MGRRLNLVPLASSPLLERAEAAVELSLHRPAEAAQLARRVWHQAFRDRDLEAVTVAQHALGLAARELGDVAGAETYLDQAVHTARRAGSTYREGRARLTLASVLALTGRTHEALEQADCAGPLLTGADSARLQAQKALILQRLGRSDEALAGYREALHAFGRLGLAADQAGVWVNRSVLLAYSGDLGGAEADLRRAEASYAKLGLDVAAAETHHNLGFVAALGGDIPTALRRYDAAAEQFRRLGVLRPHSHLDRCQALLSVGLVSEAQALVQVAVRQLEAAGPEADLAEARLVLARTTLFSRECERSLGYARLARAAFVAQSRPAWAALARHVALHAAWGLGELGRQGAREARATAEELEVNGWLAAAADARLLAARIALASGRVGEAEAELIRTSGARRAGPVELRARAWHAEALLRLARGDRRGTSAALRAGLRVLDQQRATLGATELRASAAAGATELATLGLTLALESGRPGRVLVWAERWRAGSHRMPAARPPADPALAADLAALRLVVREGEEALLAGEDAGPFLGRQARLEASIRRRARHSPCSPRSDPRATLDTRRLVERLDDWALVELVETGGRLHAVSVAQGRLRLWPLGSVAEIAAEVHQLRFSLGRLACARGSGASREAATTSARHGERRLDDVLLGPLAAELGDRSLVMVPTGPLHGLPWALLPSCRGRPLTVVPSAAQWLLAQERAPSPRPRRSVLVAGPGIAHGAAEVAELAPLHPGRTALVGDEATVAAVGTALGEADLAHVAAHGTFRADNPQFSCLHLSDGPLTVHDLEGLPSVPDCVVLSACDAGLSSVTPGDELIGLAAALLALGTRTVVASVLPVPDAATRTLMVGFQRRLMAGTPAATAMAEAQSAAAAALGGDAWRAVAAFTCFGAG